MEAHKNEGAKLEPLANQRDDEHAAFEKSEQPEDAKKEAKLGGEKHTTQHAKSARKVKNNVRKLRTERMMSKAELARRAGLSTLTVDRVERGLSSRMDTKRKILEALGLKPQDRVMVFGDTEED